MNNFERIKKMSVDELIEFLKHDGAKFTYILSVEQIKQWLLQEGK